MTLFRFLFFALMGAAAIAFAFYAATGQARYKRWGIRLLRWVVVAGLVFFAVLALQRML